MKNEAMYAFEPQGIIGWFYTMLRMWQWIRADDAPATR